MTQVGFVAKRAEIVASAKAIWGELRTNRRAMVGLFVIAVLIGGQGLLRLDGAVGAMRAALVEKTMHLRRITASAADRDWAARARSSGKLLATLKKRLWKAESEGVARANMQDWVTRAGREAGLDKLRVKTELTKPQGLSSDLPLRAVTATVTAAQKEPALTNFLDRIARDPHLFVVSRLHVQTRPIALLRMTLTTYAMLTRASAAGSGRAAE